MVINIHAGHCPDGHGANGAVGIVRESTVAREIKDAIAFKLSCGGHTVYDCTDNDTWTERDNLVAIVNKCNAYDVDLDVSIHLNCFNGQAHGTEVLIASDNSRAKECAQKVCNNIASLGFTNRGVKVRTDLYVLKRTKAPAMLIECFFCDSQEDVNLFNIDAFTNKIVEAIVGTTPQPAPQPAPAPTPQPEPQPIDWEGIKRFVISCGQSEANKFVGHHQISVDGIVGPNTHRMKVRVLQHAMNLDYHAGLEEDGWWGSKTEDALANHYIKSGETQYMVTAMEIIALINGANPNGVEYPGTFGPGLENAYHTNYLSRDAIKFCTLI